MSENIQACNTCKYAVPRDGDSRFIECHRYPVQLVGFDDDGNAASSFPIAEPTEWCGEHEERSDGWASMTSVPDNQTTEYIAALRLELDGDWHLEEPGASLYHQEMSKDYAYDKHVRMFDTLDDAADFLEAVTLECSRCLVAARPSLGNERFPRSLGNLAALLARVKEESGSVSSAIASSGCAGGVAFDYDYGNWSWQAAIYVRDGGIVGKVSEIWMGDEGWETL